MPTNTEAAGTSTGQATNANGWFNRVLVGAIAGVCATGAMTIAMRALHRRLDKAARYPLPPREITERVLPPALSEPGLRTATLAAHFGYGAAMGGLVALAPRGTSPLAGAGYGLLIWGASYFGWLPSLRILESAAHHPPQRNALMTAAHVVWGASASLVTGELLRAQAEVFSGGELADAPGASER